MKIEIVHILDENDPEPDRDKNTTLLCGTTLDLSSHICTTVEELIKEPLEEFEVLCEKCEKHPDFSIRYLSHI